MPRTQDGEDKTPASRLEDLVHEATALAKKAKKSRKSLTSDNHYANRLVELRAQATNTFRDLSSQSVGDATAMAEMIQTVFSATSSQQQRLDASRELIYALRTTWRQGGPHLQPTSSAFFPPSILADTKRGYLISIGRQMNGAFAQDWHDAPQS
jgi:hypothetical protein